MSSVLLSAPTLLTKCFSEQDYFCTQHWPEQWMAKAHGLTWLLLGAAAPMIAMGVLYSRVVYSLWIKRHAQYNGCQQVRINRNIYILLDTLLCSIAEYFYELCRILASP